MAVSRAAVAGDLPRIIELLLACEAAGQADMELRSTELRMTLGNPAFDIRRYTSLVEDEERLLAFGLLWQGRYLGMLVHPVARGALEDGILDWAEATVRDDGAASVVALCRSDDALTRATFEQRGYVLGEEELRMGRTLDAPVPAPSFPPSFTLRTLDARRELDEWLALYTDAIGPRESALRKWRAYRDDPDYDAALDLVVADRDDRLAAVCTCSIAMAELAAVRPREGRTEPVMVREDYRGIGLGRAVVLAGLTALRERGIELAALTTEADNLVAHRLYESLGYRLLYTACWYERVPGPRGGDGDRR